ncbi:MAG: PAS domain S-box protein, partial [Cellulosilyticaceae bacterium]
MNGLDHMKDSALITALSTIIEDIDDWLIVTDKEKQIVYVNKHVEKISGYPREEILGHTAQDLWATPINRILEERMAWVLQAGRRFDTITENTSKCGQKFYLATSVTALKQESEVGDYIWIGKD